jgi:hypothetical protein
MSISPHSKTWFDTVSQCSFGWEENVYTARFELDDGKEIVWYGEDAHISQRNWELCVVDAVLWDDFEEDAPGGIRIIIPPDILQKISAFQS